MDCSWRTFRGAQDLKHLLVYLRLKQLVVTHTTFPGERILTLCTELCYQTISPDVAPLLSFLILIQPIFHMKTGRDMTIKPGREEPPRGLFSSTWDTFFQFPVPSQTIFFLKRCDVSKITHSSPQWGSLSPPHAALRPGQHETADRLPFMLVGWIHIHCFAMYFMHFHSFFLGQKHCSLMLL